MNYMVNSLGEENQKALDAVIKRSGTDNKYREKLKSSPASAIKEETGIDVPEKFNIKFIENEADLTIVLPDMQKNELPVEDLEAVAGGSQAACWVDVCGVVDAAS